MRKQALNLFVFYFFAFSVNAQGLNFGHSDFGMASLEAKNNNKLIFLDFYAEWCGPCRAMENSVFVKQDVGSEFNESFVNLKINTDSKEGKDLVEKYGIEEYPSYLFLNHQGEIVSKLVGFQSSHKLLIEAVKAKRAFEHFIPISTLDQTYEKGSSDPDFLYKYLKRKSYEEGSQPTILDRYLEVVPESELQTEKVLSLISDNVTSVSSKGFYVLSESLSRFMMMTESQQKAIMKGISNSKKFTFRKAVQNKDDQLFDVLIDAVHATSYSMEAAFAEERQFRYDYAKLTKNFPHFQLIAQEEATQILSKSLEDFNKESEFTISEFKRMAKERGIPESTERFKSMLAGLENGAAKAASFQLNDFARGYYEMASDDMDFKNAIKWSAYAIKLDPTPANWETYAFLLKKSGRNKDARKAMKQALKIAQKADLETSSFKQAFQKIK